MEKNCADIDNCKVKTARKCPLCERDIEFKEYKRTNEGKYLEEWDDKRFAILCCTCFKILSHLTQKNEIPLIHPFDLSRMYRILTNLFKMEFITKEERDDFYQDFLEFTRNLRERSRLKHFLV